MIRLARTALELCFPPISLFFLRSTSFVLLVDQTWSARAFRITKARALLDALRLDDDLSPGFTKRNLSKSSVGMAIPRHMREAEGWRSLYNTTNK